MRHASSTSVLSEIVEPVVRSLNADAAQSLLGIRASKAAIKRMSVLARKCNEGALTPEEHAEYETNVMASEFLALMQAKARALLARRKKA
jgi:hypothetical protein